TELDLAKEAGEGKWKVKIALLEGQIEQERHERAAAAATADATIADLKRKNERL
ncbi:hypothetical protein E8E11_000033, partial [Didymella keratinophila]